MSLYTPVFPAVHAPGVSREGLPENTPTTSSTKQKSYVEFLRDVHLFLSSQSEVLSPPSRPNSPSFDRQVQKVRDKIQELINATNGDTSSGKWTDVSQALKLGCVRGRPWSVPKTDLTLPEEDTNWILPDEEFEWIEWEKKREESRRLKGKTNTCPQIGDGPPIAPDSRDLNHPDSAGLVPGRAVARGRPPRDVSPTTMRAAKEKVSRWQASVVSAAGHDTTSGSTPSSTKAVVATIAVQSKIDMPQRSRTLDFAVVKPAAKSIVGKMGRESLSRPAIRSGSAPTPSRKSKSPKYSKAPDAPKATTPVDVDETGSRRPSNTLPVQDDVPKIADVPETPYLPPSFPTYLETSTPLADSMALIRAKPSPILPLPPSSSTPPPSTPADPPEDQRPVPTASHASKASSPLPPQINTVHQGKRSRSCSMSLDGVPESHLLTPRTKRLRTLAQNYSSAASKYSISSNAGLDAAPDARDETRAPKLGAASPYQYDMDPLEMVSAAPLTPNKNGQPVTGPEAQGLPEKIPSPTKSVKSYFSAPDSDPAESPVKANLLLESPVSPMLSYARNPSDFLPQITSTQTGRESPTASRTNGGVFGRGYSSQFDVERHVDHVNELLAKDVDFEGWLRDVRTVETSQD